MHMKSFTPLLYGSLMVIGALFGSHAPAADASGQSGTANAASCGALLQEVAAQPGKDVEFLNLIAGTVSALNYQAPNNQKTLGKTDFNHAWLWVKNYCEKNPLRSVEDAVGALVNELYPTRSQKPK